MSDFRINFDLNQTEIAVRLNVLREVGSLARSLAREEDRSLTVAVRNAVAARNASAARNAGPQAVVITDERVAEIYGATLLESLKLADFQTLEYRIKPGEASKSLTVVGDIYRFLADRTVGRDAVIVALGGGVVSDLAGFVAATWMRGVRFVVCPTTLEADIDASIGGKTAINIPGGKNLVGAFHQPILVAVDPACLGTLDPRDVRAGLAESVKHALISSAEFLAWHEINVNEILTLDHARLTELILRNLRIKAGIVEQDAHEQTGLRMHLNFGHTIGHAIEECCGFALRHGECVSLGMVAACRLSHETGSLDASTVTRVGALLERFGLPTKLPEPIDTDGIMATIRTDKKVRGGAQRFVLLEEVGKPTVRDDIEEQRIRRAYESLLP